MKRHHINILPVHFSAVVSGKKKAEFRFNDRDYAVGDLLCLYEFAWPRDCNGLRGLSGQFIWVRITHITDLAEWAPGYVMLSIERGPFTL